MSNTVWDSSDASWSYEGVCFLWIIISLFVPEQCWKPFHQVSFIVAGAPDKTKTMEFQVEHVTYWKSDLYPTQNPWWSSCPLVLPHVQISHQILFCFPACGSSFARAGDNHPSERRSVFWSIQTLPQPLYLNFFLQTNILHQNIKTDSRMFIQMNNNAK